MPTDVETWTPPDTVEDGEHERVVIVQEIQVIQAQLGDSSRRTMPNYRTWRKGAITALTNRLHELRSLKLWLSEQYRETEGNLR